MPSRPRPRTRALRVRLTLLTLVPTAVALAIALATLGTALRVDARRDADARARTLAASALGAVTVDDDGRIDGSALREDPALAGRVWVLAGGDALVRGSGDEVTQRAVREAAAQDDGGRDVPGRVRLHTVPLPTGTRARSAGPSPGGSARAGAVVAAQPVSRPGLRDNLTLVGAAGLALLLLAAAGAATWAVAGRALRPVRELTAAAADWSERDLDRRFAGPPASDELGALTAALDGLLDRLVASLRHSRRLSADLAHELRTPLARIVAELDLLRHRERSPDEHARAQAVIRRSAEEMERIIGALMAAARTEGDPRPGRSDLAEVLERVAADRSTPLRLRGVVLQVDPPPPGLAAGVAADVVERIVTPVLENAGRYAHGRVSVGARRVDGRVRITISDDGPGVPEAEREAIFAPGTRGAAPPRPGGPDDGAGLGLALARRLAEGAGGDVRCVAGGGPGATFCIELPG